MFNSYLCAAITPSSSSLVPTSLESKLAVGKGIQCTSSTGKTKTSLPLGKRRKLSLGRLNRPLKSRRTVRGGLWICRRSCTMDPVCCLSLVNPYTATPMNLMLVNNMHVRSSKTESGMCQQIRDKINQSATNEWRRSSRKNFRAPTKKSFSF